MNQVKLPGINSNPIIPTRLKPSVTNIIGLFGFAMWAIVLILYVCSILGDLFKIAQFLSFVNLIVYIAVGCFFVMDMIKREGGRKIIDIIGLIGIILILLSSVSNMTIDFSKSFNEIREIRIRNVYIMLSGFLLLISFFAGFLGNVKLYIPSVCVISLEIIACVFYSACFIYNVNFLVFLSAQILAVCSMAWFMYQNMRIGGVDKIKSGPQYTIRQFALGICFCLFVAFIFLPIVNIMKHDLSLFDILPNNLEYFMKGYDSAPLLKVVFFTFIPAIVLLAASVKDKDYIKPLIALCLTLFPVVKIVTTSEYKFGSWMAIFVILYLVFIGLTTMIIVNSRNQIKDKG